MIFFLLYILQIFWASSSAVNFVAVVVVCAMLFEIILGNYLTTIIWRINELNTYIIWWLKSSTNLDHVRVLFRSLTNKTMNIMEKLHSILLLLLSATKTSWQTGPRRLIRQPKKIERNCRFFFYFGRFFFYFTFVQSFFYISILRIICGHNHFPCKCRLFFGSEFVKSLWSLKIDQKKKQILFCFDHVQVWASLFSIHLFCCCFTVLFKRLSASFLWFFFDYYRSSFSQQQKRKQSRWRKNRHGYEKDENKTKTMLLTNHDDSNVVLLQQQ